jgi:hypothetical protein
MEGDRRRTHMAFCLSLNRKTNARTGQMYSFLGDKMAGGVLRDYSEQLT